MKKFSIAKWLTFMTLLIVSPTSIVGVFLWFITNNINLCFYSISTGIILTIIHAIIPVQESLENISKNLIEFFIKNLLLSFLGSILLIIAMTLSFGIEIINIYIAALYFFLSLYLFFFTPIIEGAGEVLKFYSSKQSEGEGEKDDIDDIKKYLEEQYKKRRERNLIIQKWEEKRKNRKEKI